MSFFKQTQETLTGRIKPRRTAYGAVFMQVEVSVQPMVLKNAESPEEADWIPQGKPTVKWRDARLNDNLSWFYVGEESQVPVMTVGGTL